MSLVTTADVHIDLAQAAGHADESQEILHFAGLHFRTCADAAATDSSSEECPEWGKLLSLCDGNKRRAKDALIEVYLFLLTDATSASDDVRRGPDGAQLPLFG